MNQHLQRVRENILPLSVGKKVPDVFNEWLFTGMTEDHGKPSEICQLCDHEELRYWFEIRNKHTDNRLWVGSQCILKFDIPVFEGAARLDKKGAQKKLNGIMRQMRFDACLKALEDLATRESNDILATALAYFRRHKKLSPKLAFVVFWRLQRNRSGPPQVIHIAP